MKTMEVNTSKKVISRIINYDNRLVLRKCSKAGILLERLSDLIAQCNDFDQITHLIELAEVKLSRFADSGIIIPPEAYQCISDCKSQNIKIKRSYETKRNTMSANTNIIIVT